MENVTIHLAKILGKRAFLVCGAVTLLVVTLLGAVNFSSRYALKLYVEDQIKRLPWDMAAYEISELAFPTFEQVSTKLKGVKGVEQVETVTFLRTMMTFNVQLDVDNKPLQATWLSIISATNLDLLPPELRPKEGNNGGAVVALTGPKHIMGKAFLDLQGAKKFTVKFLHDVPHEGHKGEKTHVNEKVHADEVLSVPLDRVVRTEIPEINQWLLDRVGSVSFIPEVGVILVIGNDRNILTRFDRFSRGMPPAEGDP